MSVVVDWLVKNRVIIWESTDVVSGDEIDAGNACVRKLIAQARANGVENVQIFIDAFRCKYAPISIYAMSHSLTYLREGGYGWHAVCVSDSQLGEVSTKFAFQFSLDRIIIHQDVESSLLFLQGKDKRLPDLLEAYRDWVRKPPDSS